MSTEINSKNFRNQENFDTWAKQIDQEKFKLEFCLFLNCSLAVCEERILKRATDGGRADDNLGISHIFHFRYQNEFVSAYFTGVRLSDVHLARIPQGAV